ncbi:MAG: GNAT family protein [Pseudarthrobacter sp.]
MFMLQTPRLILIATPLHVIKTRLQRDDFTADVPLPTHGEHGDVHEVQRVYFPPEWPGDALVLLPFWKKQIENDPAYHIWGGTVIMRAENVAVGQMGFKGAPDEDGTVELGYGINPSYWRRGYATEMARKLAEWAMAQPEVRRLTAECLEENSASIRVLEKSGFNRIGRKSDEEGELILWERSPSGPLKNAW